MVIHARGGGPWQCMYGWGHGHTCIWHVCMGMGGYMIAWALGLGWLGMLINMQECNGLGQSYYSCTCLVFELCGL